MMKNIFAKEKIEKIYGCDHVQHSWLNNLTWKLQTVINQGLRAPDTHYCKNLKIVCRWMRGIVLQNADKEHTFMCNKKEMPTIEELEHEINYCSVHFATHFLYALEIIAYCHPEQPIRCRAMYYYRGIVEELWHLKIESKEQLYTRLADVDRAPVVKQCPVDERADKYINYG